jgi:guanylate kinase
MKGKFIIVSAPSGAGKTTIVKRLMTAVPGLEFSVSAASRAPRSHETDGKDYYFMSANEFRFKIDHGELLEWQEVYPDHYYGTLKSEVERIWKNNHHVLFDVDVQGGIILKKLYPDLSLALFIMPPSLAELEKRLRLRGTDAETSIRTRLEKAASEIIFSDRFDRVIINDDLERATGEAIGLVRQFLEND